MSNVSSSGDHGPLTCARALILHAKTPPPLNALRQLVVRTHTPRMRHIRIARREYVFLGVQWTLAAQRATLAGGAEVN